MPGFVVIANRVKRDWADSCFYGLFCATFSLVLTIVLALPKLPVADVARAPTRVRVRVQPRVVAQAPLTQTIKVQAPIPPTTDKAKPKRTVARPVPQPKTPPVSDAPDSPEIIRAGTTLDVPLFPDTPPPPPDDDRPPPTTYADKPYGKALVLAIRIDDAGNAVDVQITIPSYNALNDLGFVLAAKNVKYTDVSPPVPAGGTLWIERRIEYADTPRNELP